MRGDSIVHLTVLELGDLCEWKGADRVSMLLPHSGIFLWTCLPRGQGYCKVKLFSFCFPSLNPFYSKSFMSSCQTMVSIIVKDQEGKYVDTHTSTINKCKKVELKCIYKTINIVEYVYYNLSPNSFITVPYDIQLSPDSDILNTVL